MTLAIFRAAFLLLLRDRGALLMALVVPVVFFLIFAEIFARDGEAFFRARETEVLARLLRGAPCVLSTGGGAFLAPTNRAMIADHGVSVWLRADLDLLWHRVRHKSTRPLLKTAHPRETLRTIFEARVPVYELADVAVESRAEFSIEEMAGRVVAALALRPDALERK